MAKALRASPGANSDGEPRATRGGVDGNAQVPVKSGRLGH